MVHTLVSLPAFRAYMLLVYISAQAAALVSFSQSCACVPRLVGGLGGVVGDVWLNSHLWSGRLTHLSPPLPPEVWLRALWMAFLSAVHELVCCFFLARGTVGPGSSGLFRLHGFVVRPDLLSPRPRVTIEFTLT